MKKELLPKSIILLGTILTSAQAVGYSAAGDFPEALTCFALAIAWTFAVSCERTITAQRKKITNLLLENVHRVKEACDLRRSMASISKEREEAPTFPRRSFSFYIRRDGEDYIENAEGDYLSWTRPAGVVTVMTTNPDGDDFMEFWAHDADVVSVSATVVEGDES